MRATHKQHEHAWKSAREVEAASLRILAPYLNGQDAGQWVLFPDAPFARRLQQYGDGYLYSRSQGIVWNVEHKADNTTHPNLYLETWSNRSREKRGWLYTSRADVLMYHFLKRDDLWIYSMPELQRWAIERGGINRDGLKEVPQNKRAQLNDTWGVPVPVSLLKRQIRTVLVHPQRRTFEAFKLEPTADAAVRFL